MTMRAERSESYAEVRKRWIATIDSGNEKTFKYKEPTLEDKLRVEKFRNKIMANVEQLTEENYRNFK
jgi:hypothetical protein